MFKKILTSIIILIYSYSFALTPDEILKKVDEIRAPGDTFIFDLKVNLNESDEESEIEFLVKVKEAKKSLVIFKSPPAYKGRVLLMVENNMWIYIPGTRKPIRISPQQQMIGRISNADVARVVYSLDYRVESLAEEEKMIKMVLSAKTKAAAYKSINLWIEKETFKPIKAEFFALSDRLLKTAYYKGYKNIIGKERPTVLEIHDAIRESELTIMEYSNIKIKDTPNIYFQKTFMERAGQ